MTIAKKGETPVKESSLLASPEPITMYLLLWNIFQYCTGAMSRGRLIGLITAVFTPFGLYTIINFSQMFLIAFLFTICTAI